MKDKKMKTRQISFVMKAMAAVALWMLCGLYAAAQSTVMTKADYAKITYSWTDADQVTHENVPITEKATDARQIIELLSTVYKDARVPGPYYSAYDKDGNREDAVSYASVSDGWDISGVVKPEKEGYTVLVVTVKNDWSSNRATVNSRAALISYIEKSISSVELITDGMRIGSGESVGTLYNFSGRYNRFYFLSKGQARKNGSTNKLAPFAKMFEQFSPTTIGAGAEITDYYARLSAGEPCPVVHDCNSVTENEHYFCMNGKKGTTEYDMTAVNFFIPDYRLKYWTESTGRWPRDARSTSSAKYVNYNTSHQPMTQMYAIKLTAEAAEASTRRYTATLNWTSNLNSLAGDVEQEYYVYRVVDGKVEDEPLNSEPIYTTTWSEEVDQYSSGYALTYVVKGRPKGATFDPVQSNEATAKIPGFDPMERLTLSIEGDLESQYAQDEEYNNYTCTLQMNNGVGTSVKKQYLEQGTEFSFIRSTGEEKTVVATLKIVSVSANSYGYELTYANQSKNGKSVSKSSKSGKFAVGADDDIDFADFEITDDFSASTAANSHPDKYAYQVSFKPAIEIEGASGNLVYSNAEDVIVLKTSNLVESSFTLEQVQADVDRSLSLEPTNSVTFATTQTPTIFRYVVRRVNNDNQLEIGQAQQTTAGKYVVSELCKNSAGNYEMTEVADSRTRSRGLTVKDNSLLAPSEARYVPVIETFKTDRTAAKNTFGCDIKALHSIDVRFEKTAVAKSATTFQGDSDPSNKYRGFAAVFDVNPLKTEDLTSLKFRIWRKVGDGAEVLLNNLQPASGEGWEIESDYAILKASDRSAEIQGSALTFADLFIAPEGTNKVTYIIRFYAEDGNNSRNCYVAEKVVEIDYGIVVPTSVDGVSVSKEVLSVKYVNQQGMQSDKPFDGLNIVVKTYVDGTKSVTKEMNMN